MIHTKKYKLFSLAIQLVYFSILVNYYHVPWRT